MFGSNLAHNTLGTVSPDSYAEHLYNTASLDHLQKQLHAGPSQDDLQKWGLSRQQWQEQMLLAIDAIQKD